MSSRAAQWDAVYRDGDAPPWETGRPQPAFAALAEEGALRGNVLDAGCGTGEHALLAAASGAHAVGVDLSTVAIERAREKARTRGLAARFEVGDLLSTPLPPRRYDVVLDCGLFHTFDDDDRPRYVDALAGTVRPGGVLYLLCFSDRQPGTWGPRRLSREEIEDAFADGWRHVDVQPTRLEINPLPEADSVAAWIARVTRG